LYAICVVEPGADTEPENEPVNEDATTPPVTVTPVLVVVKFCRTCYKIK
jgi:hypothetical protein